MQYLFLIPSDAARCELNTKEDGRVCVERRRLNGLLKMPSECVSQLHQTDMQAYVFSNETGVQTKRRKFPYGESNKKRRGIEIVS